MGQDVRKMEVQDGTRNASSWGEVPPSPSCRALRGSADAPGMTKLQLRSVTRFDRSLRLRLAKLRLLVDDLADAGQRRALDFAVRRPQFRAHQRLAAVKIRLAHRNAEH